MGRARYATGWTKDGQRNFRIYAPGETMEAYPGSPVYPTSWGVVTWYPGAPTELGPAYSEAAAIGYVQERTGGQAVFNGRMRVNRAGSGLEPIRGEVAR